eukprot:scaffold2080_cov118-Isochrysis_galbana.AAC.1
MACSPTRSVSHVARTSHKWQALRVFFFSVKPTTCAHVQGKHNCVFGPWNLGDGNAPASRRRRLCPIIDLTIKRQGGAVRSFPAARSLRWRLHFSVLTLRAIRGGPGLFSPYVLFWEAPDCSYPTCYFGRPRTVLTLCAILGDPGLFSPYVLFWEAPDCSHPTCYFKPRPHPSVSQA